MKRYKMMLAGVAMLAVPALSWATAVNVDIGNADSTGPGWNKGLGTYSGTGEAPDAGTTWNSGNYGDNNVISNLLDSQGAATDISMYFQGNPNEWSYHSVGNPTNLLMNDYTYAENYDGERFTIFSNLGDGGSGLQITGTQEFDLYIYTQGDNAGQYGSFLLNSIDGTNLLTSIGDGPFDGTFTEGGNYLLFHNVVARPYYISGTDYGYEFEFIWGNAAGFAGFNGIQIVPVSSPVRPFFILGSPTLPSPDTSRTLQADIIDAAQTYSSATLYLDDVSVPATPSSAGTTNTLTYMATGLSVGTHTCEVRVISTTSGGSVVQTQSWTFEVSQPPFDSRVVTSPTFAWTTNDTVDVEVEVVENFQTVDSATFELDGGDPAAMTVDNSMAPTTTVSYTVSGLSHGVHTGRVVIVDSASNLYTNDVSFQVVLEETVATSLVHHWDFEDGSGTNVQDIVGGADGDIYGSNHAWVSGGLDLLGGGASADWNPDSTNSASAGSYVDLPNDVLSGLGNAVTFETTYIVESTAANSFLWTFGTSGGEGFSDGGTSDLACTTAENGGPVALFLWDGSNPDHTKVRDNVDVSSRVNTLTHLVWVYDADGLMSKLYVNGELVDAEIATSFPVSSLGSFNNWLGRSVWNDTMFDGKLYDFRIYNGIMTASEVADRYDAVSGGGGPTVNPDIQSVIVSGGTAMLTWTSESGATYTILSKPSLTASTWTTKKSGIASTGDGTTSDSVPADADAEFYQIKGE